MFVRTYHRCSTQEQDIERADRAINQFLESNNLNACAHYRDIGTGTTLNRPELKRLLSDAQSSNASNIVIVENVDRMGRLTRDDYENLKALIHSANLKLVVINLPTTHAVLSVDSDDSITSRVMDAVNGLMLDIMFTMAHNDQETRKRRQREGISRAKSTNPEKYAGRPINEVLHRDIREFRERGWSYSEIQNRLGCSRSTISRAIRAS